MTQREAIDKALKKHETNCCMFERGVQTLDDLLASRTVFLGVLQAAQAQAASTKDFSNLTNQAHGYSDVVSLGGMDPRNYAAANGVRQAAVKPVAYLTETEQGPMAWTPDMYGEACTYCDDGEFPVPLYTSLPDTDRLQQRVRELESDLEKHRELLLHHAEVSGLSTRPPC